MFNFLISEYWNYATFSGTPIIFKIIIYLFLTFGDVKHNFF